MSKVKESVEEFRKKLFDRKDQEVVEVAKKEVETNLGYVSYDVIQDPSTKSRKFLIVQMRYDLDSKRIVITEVRDFEDKGAALTMIKDKENLEFLFKKNNKEK